MLQRGDPVPHFTVHKMDGSEIAYATTAWQQRNLVLIMTTEETRVPRGYMDRVTSVSTPDDDTEWVITQEPIQGVPRPGVLVADRWGEIVHIAPVSSDSGLPDMNDLFDWLDFTRMRCPECEGETK